MTLIMHFSDTEILDFTLQQKENHPPILLITKPRGSTALKEITIEGWFKGTLIHEKIFCNTKILEYQMLFPGPYPLPPKSQYYGPSNNPHTYLEDTEWCFHFNRKTHQIELSHLCKGHRILDLPEISTQSFSKTVRSTLEATILATWIFDESVSLDLMPYMGHYVDTYTPLRGFHKTQDLDIVGPMENGHFLKKVRHFGPFYHMITKKHPLEEKIILSVTYDTHSTKTLLFRIPEPYGESYLSTDEGQQWIAYFERMLHRHDLEQSRQNRVTLEIPYPYDVTLDDMFILEKTSYKVVAYDIKKDSTKIIGVSLSPQNPCTRSDQFISIAVCLFVLITLTLLFGMIGIMRIKKRLDCV